MFEMPRCYLHVVRIQKLYREGGRIRGFAQGKGNRDRATGICQAKLIT